MERRRASDQGDATWQLHARPVLCTLVQRVLRLVPACHCAAATNASPPQLLFHAHPPGLGTEVLRCSTSSPSKHRKGPRSGHQHAHPPHPQLHRPAASPGHGRRRKPERPSPGRSDHSPEPPAQRRRGRHGRLAAAPPPPQRRGCSSEEGSDRSDDADEQQELARAAREAADLFKGKAAAGQLPHGLPPDRLAGAVAHVSQATGMGAGDAEECLLATAEHWQDWNRCGGAGLALGRGSGRDHEERRDPQPGDCRRLRPRMAGPRPLAHA
jgi:hypothetical protein